MLAVIFSWAICFALLVGVGAVVCRLLGFRARSPRFLVSCFWIGWATQLVLLQVWHIWLPVDGRAALATMLMGGMGLLLECRSLSALATQILAADWRAHGPVLLLAILVLVLWANLALGAPLHYDTGLYHLQAVRWNSSYPIVTGLGNLHGRLAFNNASFLYAASWDVGPWRGKSHHLANGLLSLVLVFQALAAVAELLARRSAVRQHVLLWALMLAPTIDWSVKQISSLSPEAVVFVLGVLVTGHLWALTTTKSELAEQRFRAFEICLLSAAGMTVKVTFAPMACAASGIAVAAVFIEARRAGQVQQWLGLTLALVLVAALTLTIWAIRGVLLSGYPVYPVAFGAMDVPWRVPLENVVRESEWIRAWARHPGLEPAEVLANWRWLGPWFLRQLGDVSKVVLPVTCMAAGLVAVWRGIRRAGGCAVLLRRNWAGPLAALVPSLSMLALVLATAPDLRFAGASPWLLGAGLLVIGLGASDPARFRYGERLRFVGGVAALFLGVTLVRALPLVNLPTPGDPFRALPEARLLVKKTDSGLPVHLPAGEDDRCWNAPLPSTPELDPRLTLRRDGDLAGGFALVREE
jgi:hypothetical protein